MRYLCLHRHELLSFGCTVEMQSVRLKRAGVARHLLEARDFSRVRLHTETYEESEVRIYAHSYEDLYCAEDYELIALYNDELCEYLKSEILKNK